MAKKKEIVQIDLEGNIVAKYSSIAEASKAVYTHREWRYA